MTQNTSLILYFIISATLFSGCSSGETKELKMNIQSTNDTSDASGAAVLAMRQRLISINTSIGSEPLNVTYSEEMFLCFRDTISSRFFADYEEIYGELPNPADANYLTMTKAKTGYRIFLERANDVTDEGFYVPAKGLIYQFDEACDEPDRIGPTDY